jgi:two-component system sensor histidine kinase/response regulator
MNPTYLKGLHFTKEDMGKNINLLFPKIIADNFYRNNLQVLTTQKSISAVEKLIGADGNVVTSLITKFPLQYKQQTMVAGWGINITEQVKMQQQLEEINTYKDKILTVIAHDLRSPLSVVSSIGELIGDDERAWSKEELLGFLENIQDCNNKALTLLKELTMWGQSRMNKVPYQPRQVDITGQIYGVIDFLKVMLHEKHITVDCQPLQGLVGYADLDMLKTVLRNLVSNAIKFSPLSSVITITTSVTDNDIYISIADEGIGINDEQKNRILKGTNSISSYGTNGEKGLGIGLSICKDFIEANKGVMTISPNAIQGTIFSFSLPRFKA